MERDIPVDAACNAGKEILASDDLIAERSSSLALAFFDIVGRIPAMRLFGQVSLFFLFCFALKAQEKRAFEFKAPIVRESIFREAGMNDREKDTYATNLAIYTANEIVRMKANQASLGFARKALALAMHLSPRNKRAVILKFQLERGVMPTILETQYSPKTLATLFVTRAEFLYQQKGNVNRLLARCLIDLAVTIDPRNEDAVYAYEIQKIDLGELAWGPIIDASKPVIPDASKPVIPDASKPVIPNP